MAGRKALCESLAVQCSLAAQRDDPETARASLEAAVQRNADVRSAGLRRDDGRLLVSVGSHEKSWTPLDGGRSTDAQMVVPILQNDDPWGTLELRFDPLVTGFFSPNSLNAFLVFVGIMCFGVFFLLLRRAFGGATEALPQRVKTAMNTLAEGVLILDKNERIAMANAAFADLVGMRPEELRGKTVDELPFLPGEFGGEGSLPWKKAVQGEAQIGVVMGLQGEQAMPKRVSINSTPIVGDDGVQRGAMATFDNLTALERKHAQLRKVLSRLRQSRKVVRRQNHELKALATRDPLTGCFNRRTLFAEFEKHWEASKRFKKPLACIMIDIDHFKNINDRFGHSAGDEVLKTVAETLRKTARRSDLVCRYGGEEFCILLPQIDLPEATMAAERFRQALAEQPLGGVLVTASLGVSAIGLGSKHPQELLDQADKALYAAKRSGRNRAVRYDEAPTDLLKDSPKQSSRKSDETQSDGNTNTPVSLGNISIPYQAVSGLLAALAYRHAETAEHCKRVADLCVTVGGGVLSQRELYVVEMAALLHDIGKLGVPDHVLLKAGPLTTDEWKLVRMHEKIGIEIVRTAFTSDELVSIIQMQHAWYGGTPTDPGLPKGQKIPIGARLLAVANAFDSMVNEQVYRKAMIWDESFTELRRCGGTQFDPVLVERFISALSDSNPKAPKPQHHLSVSKQAALKIGVQIEKLAMAADVQDVASLSAMAGQLKTMAQESGIPAIADVAEKLEKSAATQGNHVDLMELTIDLLELCRQTQRALLPDVNRPKRVRSGAKRDATPLSLARPDLSSPRPTPKNH
jgi:diguanylate cyclase (GGDEF)-like protein/PAS domain S-box-containing protein